MRLTGERPPASGSLPRETLSADPLVDAVTALYAACHLPPPAVLAARDAMQFARILARLAGGSGLVAATCCLVLGPMLAAMLIPPLGDPVGTAYGAFLGLFVAPWLAASDPTRRASGAAFGEFLRRVTATLLLGMAVAGVAWLAGLEQRMPMVAAGLAMGLAGCLQLAAVPLAPCLARWWLRDTALPGSGSLPLPVLVGGTKSLGGMMLPRLVSALNELDQAPDSGAAIRAASRRIPPRLDLRTILRAETLNSWSIDPALVLGQSVGFSFDPAARIGVLAEAGFETASLPRLLQAALELDRRAEAVAVFRGVAVVLPAGAPARFTPALAASPRNRRSGRPPWRAALGWLDRPRPLALAVDLAPMDRMADWLLARSLARLAAPERRTPALRALGVGRAVAALRLRPVQADEHGRLYQIGSAEAPSAFVAVRDRVLDAGGAPLEHWIAVPPHVATAREAVAWSFSMDETAYGPARET